MIKKYLVGGAVRDELLGRPVKERDWVVVGATPDWMIEHGYQPIGKDFPVFLHPKTKEEYALARTERKSGMGHKGFIFYTAKEVTLEEDLKRRDLTINAIAKNELGDFIDPFHGQEDLKNKQLRHVSPAFAEDPLRVLRVARFSAYLGDFNVVNETLQLMQQISESGELLTLSKERIWKELERVMSTSSPARFFEVLEACHARIILFPELQNWDLLKDAARLSSNPLIRLSTLLGNLNQDQINKLSKRISLPSSYQELALMIADNYEDYQKSLNQKAPELLLFLKKTDAFRRPERFKQFLLGCQIKLGTKGEDERSKRLEKALTLCEKVRLAPESMQGLSGKEIGEMLDKKREEAICIGLLSM